MTRNFPPSLHSVISSVRRPLAVSLAAACALALVSARPAQAQAVYTYRSTPFELFSCTSDPYPSPSPPSGTCSTPDPTFTSYRLGDFITITLTLDAPLPPSMPFHDISQLPGFRLVISDEHQTVTSDNASTWMTGAGTDATGQINEWDLGLFEGNVGIESWRLGSGTTLSLRSYAALRIGDPGGLPADYAYNFTSSGTWTSNVTGAGADTMVKDLLRLLSDPALGLTSGQINSLSTKLQNVLTSIAAGDTAQAVNQLNAFINQVQAAGANGKISAEVAAALIAAAQAIIAVLLL